jgi:hypothetical protein
MCEQAQQTERSMIELVVWDNKKQHRQQMAEMHQTRFPGCRVPGLEDKQRMYIEHGFDSTAPEAVRQ